MGGGWSYFRAKRLFIQSGKKSIWNHFGGGRKKKRRKMTLHNRSEKKLLLSPGRSEQPETC